MTGPAAPLVLGVETSCDETSAAVLSGDQRILGHVILSQDVHEIYGGVVPELAARAHLEKIDLVVDRALAQAGVSIGQIDLLGATAGPGLIGALLVGVCWVKAAAYALGRPWVPVHHMEAHLFSPSLEDASADPPFVALLVSGGHTILLHAEAWGRYRLLGQTRDDAAGEAFDKVAKLLGLRYPGGPEIERLAAAGDPSLYPLPRPLLSSSQRPGRSGYFDFSFSGLKTAVVQLVSDLDRKGSLDSARAHVAAAFQDAVVDVLTAKTLRAVEHTGCARVLLGGGVSANGALRAALADRLEPEGRLFVSTPRLALDNGAMVARAARFRYDVGDVGDDLASASASLAFPGLRLPGDP